VAAGIAVAVAAGIAGMAGIAAAAADIVAVVPEGSSTRSRHLLHRCCVLAALPESEPSSERPSSRANRDQSTVVEETFRAVPEALALH
jgi:hypothetical protein